MAQMKVSNEEIIRYANEMNKAIQYDRHIEECKALVSIESDFDAIKPWFSKKPDLKTAYEKAQYIFDREYKHKEYTSSFEFYSKYKVYPVNLDSDLYSKQLKTCLKLKYMAKNNEDEYLSINREEAESLGIC